MIYISVVKPGDKWCLCEYKWEEAYNDGKAPKVIKNATNMRTKKEFKIKLKKIKKSMNKSLIKGGSYYKGVTFKVSDYGLRKSIIPNENNIIIVSFKSNEKVRNDKEYLDVLKENGCSIILSEPYINKQVWSLLLNLGSNYERYNILEDKILKKKHKKYIYLDCIDNFGVFGTTNLKIPTGNCKNLPATPPEEPPSEIQLTTPVLKDKI